MSPLSGSLAAFSIESGDKSPHSKWHVLCRELKHVEELLDLGVTSIMGDFAELRCCGRAVGMARERAAEIFLATPRIQKPGEDAHFQRIADARPDGFLVRNLGGVSFCLQRQIPFVADMTLNAVNQWTVAWLHELGRPPRDGRLRRRSPPVRRVGRGRAVGRTGGGRASIHAAVPHGALHL